MTNREKRWLQAQGIDPAAAQAERLQPKPPPTLEEAYTNPNGYVPMFRSFTLQGEPGTRFEAGQEVTTGEGYTYVMIQTVTVGEEGTVVGETIYVANMRGVRPDIALKHAQWKRQTSPIPSGAPAVRGARPRAMHMRSQLLTSALLLGLGTLPFYDPEDKKR